MEKKNYTPIRKLKTRLPNSLIDNITQSNNEFDKAVINGNININENKTNYTKEEPTQHNQKIDLEVESILNHDESLDFSNNERDELKKFRKLKFLGIVILLILILVYVFSSFLNKILDDSFSNEKNLFDYELDFDNLTEVFGEEAYIVTGIFDNSYQDFLVNLDEDNTSYIYDFIDDVIRNNTSYSDIITKMNYEQTAGFLQLLIDRFANDYLNVKSRKVFIDEDMLVFCEVYGKDSKLLINPRLIDAGIVDFNDAIKSLLRTFMMNESFSYKLESASASEIIFKAEQGDRKVRLQIDRSPGAERFDDPKIISLNTNEIVYRFGIPTYPGFGKLASTFSKSVENYFLPRNEGGTYRTIEVIFDGSTYEFTEIEVGYNSSNLFSRAELITNGNVEILPKVPYVSKGFHYSTPLASKYEHIYIPFKSGQSLRVVDEMGTIIHPEITTRDFDFKFVEDELKLNMTPVEISTDGIVFSIEADHFENNVWICAEYRFYGKKLCSIMYDEATNEKLYTFPREGEQDFKLEAGKQYIFYLRYSIKDEDRSLARALFEEEIAPSTEVSIVVNQTPFIISIPESTSDGNIDEDDNENSNESEDSESSGK